ncbi:hypothetical protein [Streptomyces sp. SID8373]|uniref:hypothetical protein n=3 Tax=unclassified Streptomyces TaxID=2593676 RepID=UPI0003673DCD|nr:hypothetical protein [Streptomyces sp. SID8373]MYX64118.1 hypothetical protein [Streptomyces sp. SID8373]
MTAIIPFMMIPQLSDFLTPADIEIRMEGFGYERGTAVVWLQDTWAGPGDPATFRRGVLLLSYLEGEHVNRTRLEGANDLGDQRAQKAAAHLQRDLIATHGQRYLEPWRAEIEHFGNPQHLISKNDDTRAHFYRRVKNGDHTPKDLALIADVEAKEAELKSVRRKYAIALWRYLAHLHKHGMSPTDIARWTGQTIAEAERRISSVSTAGAAAIAGVETKSWSAYVARGQAPAPDDYVGREPVWHLSSVLGHLESRPGTPGRPPQRTR